MTSEENSLAFSTLGTTPKRWMLFLHGILGSGINWKSFARSFVDRCPSWGAALIDLRMHGASQRFDGPHTIHAAATDLLSLASRLNAPVEGVFGHSFGGKVALEYVALRKGDLEEAWIVDSYPGARPGGKGSEDVLAVLGMLDRAPKSFASRDAFRSHVVEEGFSPTLAQWLAMNLERVNGEQHLALDLVAIRALLSDYFEQDRFDVVREPPGRVAVHLAIAERSTLYSETDREAVMALATGSRGRVTASVVPKAGHWVHVDAPEALLELVAAHCDRTATVT